MSNVRPESMERITTEALADAFIEEQVAAVKAQVGDKKVLLALSGGVDSSVVAALLIKAIGKNLVCVHVNHGLLRKGEPEQVVEVFRNKMNANLVYVDAVDRFLDKLAGVAEPEQKRKIIGAEFIRVFEEEARKLAKKHTFNRVVLFGLGTTGIFIGDLIRQNYPEAKIVFVARSDENSPKVKFALKQVPHAVYVKNSFDSDKKLADAITTALGGKATVFIGVSGSQVEHKIAFEQEVLGCNGIYNSFSLGPVVGFDSMPFGFKNHLIFSSINFRQEHMEKAIQILAKSNYDEIVELIDKEEFISDPKGAYLNKIYSKSAPLKTAVIWNDKYIDVNR